MKKIASLVAILIAAFHAGGCSPKYSVVTPELQAQMMVDLKSGNPTLTCQFECDWSWLSNFKRMIALHNASQWKPLAELVMQVGHEKDITYYFLGRSAEGLGYRDAAAKYYQRSLDLFGDATNLHHCRSLENGCAGIDLASLPSIRIAAVKTSTQPDQASPAARKTAAVQPMTQAEYLEFKTMLHVKHASQMCNWPMTESRMHEARKYIEYYRPRMGGFQFKLEDATAAGVINGRGLVAFCTDDIERKRYDGIVQAIKPFEQVHGNANSLPSISTQALTNTTDAAPITNDILNSVSVKLPYGGVDTVDFTFKDGGYSAGVPIGDPEYLEASIDDRAFGDLNGDKIDDAAIIASYNSGGSGIFFSVTAVLSAAGKPWVSNAQDLGDRPKIKSLKIKAGKIVVDAVIAGPNDSSCCPTQKATLVYVIRNGKLV